MNQIICPDVRNRAFQKFLTRLGFNKVPVRKHEIDKYYDKDFKSYVFNKSCGVPE